MSGVALHAIASAHEPPPAPHAATRTAPRTAPRTARGRRTAQTSRTALRTAPGRGSAGEVTLPSSFVVGYAERFRGRSVADKVHAALAAMGGQRSSSEIVAAMSSVDPSVTPTQVHSSLQHLRGRRSGKTSGAVRVVATGPRKGMRFEAV